MSLKIITVKDVENLTQLSKSSANRLIKEIRNYYGLRRRITETHLYDYLGLKMVQNDSYTVEVKKTL